MGLHLKIDGSDYELPDRITLGEARIIERYAVGQMSVNGGYSIAQLAGMIHIAIKRARPALSFEEIGQRIDELDFNELGQMLESAEGNAQEEAPAAERPIEPNGSSNADSVPPSDADQESEIPETFGSRDSDTGFHSFHAMSES